MNNTINKYLLERSPGTVHLRYKKLEDCPQEMETLTEKKSISQFMLKDSATLSDNHRAPSYVFQGCQEDRKIEPGDTKLLITLFWK